MFEWTGTLYLLVVAGAVAPLVYAGVAKLLDPEGFAIALPKYALAFVPARPASARAIAALELGGAGLALAGSAAGAALASAVFAFFALVLNRARRRGETGDCGCFGALPAGITRTAVARNLSLAVVLLAVTVARAMSLAPRYEMLTGIALTVSIALGSAALDTVLAVSRARASESGTDRAE